MATIDSSSTIDDSATGTTSYGQQAGPTDPLGQTGQQLGDEARGLTERATGVGYKQADRGREAAARGMDKVAQTIRRVSGEMETEPGIADAAETTADQIQRASRYLEEKDAREILGDIEDQARRQPLLFLGGAFLLGMAAARLIKAGTENQASDRWASDGNGRGTFGPARGSNANARGAHFTATGETAGYDEGR